MATLLPELLPELVPGVLPELKLAEPCDPEVLELLEEPDEVEPLELELLGLEPLELELLALPDVALFEPDALALPGSTSPTAPAAAMLTTASPAVMPRTPARPRSRAATARSTCSRFMLLQCGRSVDVPCK